LVAHQALVFRVQMLCEPGAIHKPPECWSGQNEICGALSAQILNERYGGNVAYGVARVLVFGCLREMPCALVGDVDESRIPA